MSSRRLRSKYKANRNRRRVEKIKLVAKYLIAGIVVAVVMWQLIPSFANGCSPKTKDVIRLGGD